MEYALISSRRNALLRKGIGGTRDVPEFKKPKRKEEKVEEEGEDGGGGGGNGASVRFPWWKGNKMGRRLVDPVTLEKAVVMARKQSRQLRLWGKRTATWWR